MSIAIRNERPGDEEALNLVNYLAFEDHNTRDDGIADLHEADLVRYLRAYYPRYDRSLSIVAWDGDRAVGHALFTPAEIRLLGETVRALAVGPVAVIPEYQRQGVGGKLLEFGHDVGREQGYALAFLLGHPEYYPRAVSVSGRLRSGDPLVHAPTQHPRYGSGDEALEEAPGRVGSEVRGLGREPASFREVGVVRR